MSGAPTHRESEIAALVRQDGLSMSAAGKVAGVSRQRVQQVLEKAKFRARSEVARAKKRGALVYPAKCSNCGANNCKIEAHHPDYAEPTSVAFLCLACHRAADAGTISVVTVRFKQSGHKGGRTNQPCECGARPMKTIICECGRVHWTSSKLREVHDFVAAPGREVTSREVADTFGLSIQNANNRLRALVSLGLVEESGQRTHETGGIEKFWKAAPK